jgi:hypothetical protein
LNAINWLRDLKEEGKEWNLWKIHRNELYPNMCNNFDYPWHGFKEKLSKEIGEITLLWNCGVKERKKAHQKNIFHWKNLNSKSIDFKGKKSIILDNIIKINKYKNPILLNNTKKLNKQKIDFFVDFETVNSIDINFDHIINYNPIMNNTINNTTINNNGIIFMIGIGYINPYTNKWIFKSFVADQLNNNCEEKIIKDWLNYMSDIKKKYKMRKNINLYHWSKAEISEFNKALKKHYINNISLQWYDLLNYFKDNNIVIKDSFNFGLKNIANALYQNKLIKTKWSDNSLDGTQAMYAAWICQEKIIKGEGKKLTDFKEIQNIINYNETDCKVLWDILNLFI